MILKQGSPMQRGDLLEALIKNATPVRGNDPANNLGTMMWRMKDKFVNIDGYRYWPSDVPFAAAGYDPNAPETEAEFQVRVDREHPDMDATGNLIRD